MFDYKIEIIIKDLTKDNASAKAKAAEIIANNIDLEALQILASKSNKPGVSNKVKKFKNLM